MAGWSPRRSPASASRSSKAPTSTQTTCAALFGEFLDKVNAAGPDAIALHLLQRLRDPVRRRQLPASRSTRGSTATATSRSRAVRLFDLLRPLADAPALAEDRRARCGAAAAVPDPGRTARAAASARSSPRPACWSRSRPRRAPSPRTGPGPTAPMRPPSPRWCASRVSTSTRMFARIRLRTNEATNGAADAVGGLAAPAGRDAGSRRSRRRRRRARRKASRAPQTAIGAPVVRRRAPPRPIQDIGPEEAYAYAVEQDDLPTYVEYVRVYPNSAYAQRIWAHDPRAARGAAVAARAAVENTPEAYWTYIAALSGRHVCLRRAPPAAPARRRADVRRPAGACACTTTCRRRSRASRRGFIDVYPAAPPPRALSRAAAGLHRRPCRRRRAATRRRSLAPPAADVPGDHRAAAADRGRDLAAGSRASRRRASRKGRRS